MKSALSLTLIACLVSSTVPAAAQGQTLGSFDMRGRAIQPMAGPSSFQQALQSFEDLALRVNLDDQLQIEDQSGVEVTGRLTRLTRNEITIRTQAGEKRFTSDTPFAWSPCAVTRSARAHSSVPGCSWFLMRWRLRDTDTHGECPERSAPPQSARAPGLPWA